MFLKPKTIIGMEITPSRIKMVEMDYSSRPAKVLNFANVELPSEHQENIASRIRAALDENGFITKKVNISLSGPLLNHRVITLPPMSRAEMRTVVKREINKESKIPPFDLSFDYWAVGEVEEGGIKKNEVMIAATSAREVNEVIALARESELEPQVLSTSSLALVNSLKMMGERGKEEIAFVYLGIESSTIVIVDGWTLRFSREFTLGLERRGEEDIASPERGIGPLETGIDIPQRVTTEINRSFLYYKQRFRGRQPDRIILAGEIGEVEEVRSFLESELKAEVEIFDPADSLDLSSLKEREEEFFRVLPSFAISLGSGWRGLKDIDINLLPTEFRERKQLMAKTVAMVMVTAVFFILLIGGCLGLSKSLSYYKAILQNERENWEPLKEETYELLQAKSDRSLHKSRISLFGDQTSGSSLWKGRLKALSLLVPDEMVFSSFSARKEKGMLMVDMQGSVVTDDAAQSQAIFNRFYSRLKESVLVKNIEPPEIRLKPFEKTSKGNQPVGEEMEKKKQILSEVSFEINCHFWQDYL